MSLETTRLPDELADQLVELKTWVRWQWILRGAGRIGVIAAVGFGTALWADWRYDLSPATRLAAIGVISGIVLLAAIMWLVIPLCRRMGWTELAALADQAHPEWDGSLTSSVELCGSKEVSGFAGSPVMRELMLEQTKQQAQQLDPEEVVSSRRAWNAVRAGLAAAVLLFVPVFIAPSTYRQLWGRLLTPNDNWGSAGVWQIDVADGDRVVARGADVELLATAKRNDVADPPKTLMLEWRDAAGTADRRAMPFDEIRKAFVALVPHVMRDVQFRVVAEKQKSREYRIQVVEPPVVTKIRLDVEPPAYCGWPAQSIDGAVGSIRVFEQSRLRFSLEFNKPVETAHLAWQHGRDPLNVQLAADRRSATLEFAADPKQAGPFSFAVADEHKLKNNDIAPRELLIATDELPKLAVRGEHSTEVRPDDVVPIEVTASDDIGIGQLELHLSIADVEQPLQPADNVQGQKQIEHRFTLDLNSLKLTHGDLLVYKVRLTDEQPPPGPHEVWSQPRVLRINRKAAPPGANDLAKSQEQLRDELQDLQRDAKDRANEIEQFQKELEKTRRDKDVPDKERFDALTEKLEKLTERGEKLAEQLARDPLFKELGEQVRDVTKQELQRAEKEVAAARDEKLSEQQRDLRQAKKDLDEAAKKLAAIDKPFQQLADLQKDLLELKRLARQAEQLAQRAEELAQAEKPDSHQPDAQARANDPRPDDAEKPETAKPESLEAAAERQRLADQQKQLAEALADLLKRRPELLNAAKRDQLEQLEKLADEARQLAEQQQQLADALKELQQQAAEKSAQLAEKQRDLQAHAEQAAEKTPAANKPNASKPDSNNPATDEGKPKAADKPSADKPNDNAANSPNKNSPDQPNAAKPDGDSKPKTEKPNADSKPNANDNQPKDNNSPEAPQPLNRDALNAAAEALQKGDLAEALRQQKQAASELDRLANDLEKAKADLNNPKRERGADESKSDPTNTPKGNDPKDGSDSKDQKLSQPNELADAAKKLADQQSDLSKKSAEAAKSDSADEKQKSAEQLAADQAKLNDQIAALPKPDAAQPNNKSDDAASDNKLAASDNKPAANNKPNANDKPAANDKPKSDRAESARKEAMQRAEQAEQALKNSDLEQAAQQQQQAAQALNELAKQAAAPQPAKPSEVDQPKADQQKSDKPNANSPEAKPQPGNDPPKNNPAGENQPMPNAKPSDPQAQQLAQLAEEQRQLAKEVAQAIQEQRGEQPKPQEPGQQPDGQKPDGQKAQQPKSGEPPSVAQQARDAQAAQRELADEAKQLEQQVQRELGSESAEAKQAQQTARLCES